jgi:dUTP pyrophosphatase
VSGVRVAVERLAHAADLPFPAYASAGAAGADLLAAIAENAPVTLAPGQRALLPTGIRIALPDGHEAQIRPRSGLAASHGITVLNAPGTVDSDYRGEIGVILINLGHESYVVRRGARMAQLVISPIVRAIWVETSVDPRDTQRGSDGFGSTDRGTPNTAERVRC